MKPFDFLMKIGRENVERTKENNKFIFGDSDKIIIWLVGFSFAGISLILSNIEILSAHFDFYIIKSILIFFALTSIFGIINKISSYYVQTLLSQIQIFLEKSFGNETVIGLSDNFDIVGETDVNIVINRLINNFHVVPKVTIEQYNNSEKKDNLMNILKNQYIEIRDYYQKEVEIGLGHIASVYQKAFGYKKKETDKFFQRNDSSGKYKLFIFTWETSFIWTCFFFLATMVFLIYEVVIF